MVDPCAEMHGYFRVVGSNLNAVSLFLAFLFKYCIFYISVAEIGYLDTVCKRKGK